MSLRTSGVSFADAICSTYPKSNRGKKGAAMPAAVKIKAGKYGNAIGLLLRRGGTFQTRHERTLIVNSDQKKALEEAGLIEGNGMKKGSSKGHGRKEDAGC
jgi:hypothetical protein